MARKQNKFDGPDPAQADPDIDMPLPPLPDLSWIREPRYEPRTHSRNPNTRKREPWEDFFDSDFDPWGLMRRLYEDPVIGERIEEAIDKETQDRLREMRERDRMTPEELEIDRINRDKIDAVDEAEERLPWQRFWEGPDHWGVAMLPMPGMGDNSTNRNVAMLPMPGNGDNVVPILERIERMMQEIVG